MAVIGYMEYRKWRSTLFLNLSVLAFGALLAKIGTNFAAGKPGFAGIRVPSSLFLWLILQLNGTINFGCFRKHFKHKDLDLRCEPFYHLQRYLETEGVIIPDTKNKNVIDQIYEACLHGEVYPSRGTESSTTSRPLSSSENTHLQLPSNVPSTRGSTDGI